MSLLSPATKPRESITLLRLRDLPWIMRGSSSSWAKMMVEINKRRKGRTVHLHLRVVGIHLALVGILIGISGSSATTDEVVWRRILRVFARKVRYSFFVNVGIQKFYGERVRPNECPSSLLYRQIGLVGSWACPQEGLVSGGVFWEILAGFWSF